MRKLVLTILFLPALLLAQTSTVTVNQTTKVTQPTVGKLTLDGASNFFITRGTGTPEGTVTASPGSLYLDISGSLWLKASGTGNTGWVVVEASSVISDAAFGSSWNGATTIAPSKNAVYDEIHAFDTDDDGKVNVLDVVSSAGFLAVTSGGVPVEGRTLTEGLAIDITNPTGAAGAPTFAFDPTELTGSRTWGDGSTDTIIWTFDRATGTDSTITSLNAGIGVQSLTDAALTSGRVTFAGASGILTDDADLTFATDTLTATNAKVTSPTNTTTSVVTVDGSQTLTNKRINPRVTTITSNATWSPNADTDDIYEITAQAVDATTISNPSGTPVNGQKLIIKVTGTAARALTWSGSQWRGEDIALPTTTTTTKTMYLGFIYNSTGPKWDLLAKVDNF